MIEQEIKNLKNLSLPELRTLYLEYLGEDNISFNRQFYIKKLAYRMQELTYGGIPNHLMRRILSGKIVTSKPQFKGIPPVGTRLIKVYHGKEHEVRILTNGFEYQNKIYKSLSAIALKISGRKQWGLFFFGLSSKRSN